MNRKTLGIYLCHSQIKANVKSSSLFSAMCSASHTARNWFSNYIGNLVRSKIGPRTNLHIHKKNPVSILTRVYAILSTLIASLNELYFLFFLNRNF